MKIVLFLLAMMIGVFVQALAGFGGTLLSMPLGIMLIGMETAKPVTTILAWLTGIGVAVMEFRHINFRELLKMSAVMLVGVLGAMWAAGKVKLTILLIIYALIVIAIGIKKLFFPTKKEAPRPVQGAALAAAGVMQGLYVSGGSFLAVYSMARLKDSQEFRATVNAVWAIIDTAMFITYWVEGSLTSEVLTLSGIALIPTAAAMWLGGYLTKRVKQQTFLKMVYIVLIISGIALLSSNL